MGSRPGLSSGRAAPDRAPRCRLALCGLLVLFASPVLSQAINPFESFDDNLKQLKDRIRYYSSNYPDVVIPDEMKGEKLEQLTAQGAMSQMAARKLRAMTELLDRVVLGVVKREVYQTGQKVKSDPTSHSTYSLRSTLLLEFGAILKRQKLHFSSYFPKGDGYLQRLRVETDVSYKMADEMFTHLAALLRDEMEKIAAAGGKVTALLAEPVGQTPSQEAD